MKTRVKICGLTTAAAVDAAVIGGASHIGLVFVESSVRAVVVEQAAALAARVPAHVGIVALFASPSPDAVQRAVAAMRIDIIQLHGDEDPGFAAMIGTQTGCDVWKAINIAGARDLDRATAYREVVARMLYDAAPRAGMTGGTGHRFDWAVLNGFAHPLPWALAGGLDADNVADAIRTTRAPLVDVSSGVESAPGIKDVDKIAAFLRAAASA